MPLQQKVKMGLACTFSGEFGLFPGSKWLENP